mgnify:CR=1 FL=1
MAKVVKKTVKREVKTLRVSNILEAVNAEMARDQITALRAEMTHYVTESVAVSILALLLFIGAPSVFPEIINPYLPSSLKIMQAFIMIPSVFWLITILGNMVRYFKILKLQDKLFK